MYKCYGKFANFRHIKNTNDFRQPIIPLLLPNECKLQSEINSYASAQQKNKLFPMDAITLKSNLQTMIALCAKILGNNKNKLEPLRKKLDYYYAILKTIEGRQRRINKAIGVKKPQIAIVKKSGKEVSLKPLARKTSRQRRRLLREDILSGRITLISRAMNVTKAPQDHKKIKDK